MVIKFSASNYRISADYELRIEVIVPDRRTLELALHKPAYLKIHDDCIHGVITEWRLLSSRSSAAGYIYEVVMASPLVKLKSKHNRVFENRTVAQIAEQILLEAGFAKLDFSITSKKHHAKIPLLIQLEETDLNFFERILSQHNLAYIFLQNKNRAKLIIFADKPELENAVQLQYCSALGMVNDGNIVCNIKEEVIWDSSNTLQREFYANTNCTNLQLGLWVRIIGHPIESFNQEYLVVAIEIFGKDNVVSNKLTLIIADSCWANKKISHPIVDEIIVATIAGSEDKPMLDREGNYRVKLPYYDSGGRQLLITVPICLMQPTNNMHFPLLPGTKVALACIDADISRPVILGVVSEDNNLVESYFKTPAGNSLVISEQKDREFIELNNNNCNRLLLSSKKEQQQVVLESMKGAVRIETEKEIILQTAAEHKFSAAADLVIASEEDVCLLSAKDSIQYNARNDISLKADDIQVEAAKLVVSANSGLKVKATEKLQFSAVEGGIEMQAKAGLAITAEDELVMVSSAGSIFIGSTLANITCGSDGSLLIRANKLILEADEINVYGESHLNA